MIGMIMPTVYAQQPAEKPVFFRALSIGNSAVPLLYAPPGGGVVTVSARHSELSQSYISPPDGMLSFYREAPPEKPGDKPRRVPIADARLGKDGPYIVVLVPRPTSSDPFKTDVQVIDDSWVKHPSQTARVFNFSNRRAAVQVANTTTVELNTGETHIFPYPSGKGYVILKVATMEEEGWTLRWNSPQGIVPDVRPTFVITDMLPTEEDPHPLGIDITNVFDTSQPAPPTNER